jgi:hypothetical protein
VEKSFRFSNLHADFQARDAKSVFGWRYTHVFAARRKLVDGRQNTMT